MTDLDKLKAAFAEIGVEAQECDERLLQTERPDPAAEKYISVQVAHFHFDAEGKFLGTECNGKGDFIKTTK